MERRTLMMIMMLTTVVTLTWQKQCYGWGTETAEDMVRNEAEHAKNAAETAKKMASDAAHDTKDKTASWAGWVSDKIST